VPPTENRGRTHTSVVKVAVLELQPVPDIVLHDKDIIVTTTRGSGPGGQHRNKVETAVRITHTPTGIVVRCETERSQYQNKVLAYEILQSKLRDRQIAETTGCLELEKERQMGSGQRVEKIRTYDTKRGLVTDHRTNRQYLLSDWMKGKWQWNHVKVQ
jgi:peptide chain release factor 1